MKNKKNLTVSIDELLLKRSKHLAVEQDLSLSEWVGQIIANEVRRQTGREAAKRRALSVLKRPLRLGGNVFSRDELHER